MDLEIFDDVDPADYEDIIWSGIEESEKFSNFFYFVSTLNELQQFRLIGEQVEITQGLHNIFYAMRDDGYSLSRLELSRVTNDHPSWNTEKKQQLIRFYDAYHKEFGNK